MSEITNKSNTITEYLGPEFQKNLIWQILVEPEFAEKVINDLAVEYFDDPNMKRLFIIIVEYFKEYGKAPNLYNNSIQTAVYRFKTPDNKIEEESLLQTVENIKFYNEHVLNGKYTSNGGEIQKETTSFIKQQEYRKLGEFILSGCRSGEIRKQSILGVIEEKINKISRIGDTEDQGTSITEGVDKALRKEFRETIPTGVVVIDALTGGGLGKGETGFILTPSGVGKSTFLTKVANTGYEEGENVLQIIFEDTEDQIKRKHYTIWSKIPLSETDARFEEVGVIVQEKLRNVKGGRLIIKKFSQENTTMISIRDWMKTYEKKNGFKFSLLVLDYLDCLESHKKVADRNEAELVIVKSFLALAADFNIPAWTALQGNRGSFDTAFLEVKDMGGNIKRIQKSHFFMSVAKPNDIKDTKLANVKIIKARFAKDGQMFKNSKFDNDYLDIDLNDEEYKNYYSKRLPKGVTKTVDLPFGLPTDNPQHDGMLDKFLHSKAFEPKNEQVSPYSIVGNVEKKITINDIPEVVPIMDEIEIYNYDDNKPLLKFNEIGYPNGDFISTTTTTERPIDIHEQQNYSVLEVDKAEPIVIDVNTSIDPTKCEISLVVNEKKKRSRSTKITKSIIIKKKGRSPKYTKEIIDRVIQLRSENISRVEISRQCNLTVIVIQNIIGWYNKRLKDSLINEKSVDVKDETPLAVEEFTANMGIIEEPITTNESLSTPIVDDDIVKTVMDEETLMDRDKRMMARETFIDPDK